MHRPDLVPAATRRPPPPPHIVVVDDDEPLLSALRFALELDGFRVTTHNGAAEVIADQLPRRAGCLVIDYWTPQQTGLDLLARHRAEHVSLPAIIITSYAPRDVVRRAEGFGARIVEKPLLRDELTQAIRGSLVRLRSAP